MAIIQGRDQTITLTLRVAGAPVSIEATAAVTAQIFKADGVTATSRIISIHPNAPGAQWANGVVVIELLADDTHNLDYPTVLVLITAQTSMGLRTWSASIDTGEDAATSALTNRATAINRLRAAMLHGAASKLDIDQSLILDDELWQLWLASEDDAARRLGFPLQPTEVFSYEPSLAEVSALNGAPYIVEPGYDMPPDFFSMQTWGALKLRVAPLLAVDEVRLVYPSMTATQFVVPKNWIRIDHKYAQLQIIPGPGITTAPVSIFMVQSMGAGYRVPHMIQVRYRAGIDASRGGFNDLIDLVKQSALLRLMQGAFVPASGSISADGLSQSFSTDMDKWQESLEHRFHIIKEKTIGPQWGVL